MEAQTTSPLRCFSYFRVVPLRAMVALAAKFQGMSCDAVMGTKAA
jgi:hypothetical protein